ncbi:putative Sin3 binding protein-domain-containing protein [Pseudomassariella vexata]|uniref:Putative Sin3 binding protein-domain-containing protein n=1 Tax=Pseudomassariella vexata TaxID=1141098 RepID=A0A1Y2EEZ6_9PEZI|nr:putative Sin3 binding protein-domain-containing protein [Pseudomassariella vexata]ORY70163.1 putative Sin3 binding protein-domain-containing protein [Pseudomassariella vexata]
MASLATAAAARDIPKTSVGRDNLTAVAAARSVPVTRTHPLPTPPNSISPALPPHGLKAQLHKASKLEPIDSDLDLHDSTESDLIVSPTFESAGAITPALLSKYHLPEILLSHGPLAIRHIMGYLTTSVPGFAGIPPPKARRLVVAALEGKGHGSGVGGGVNGDVEYEKVGWGRWDAKRRGHFGRYAPSRLSPGASTSACHRTGTGTGIPINKAVGWSSSRSRLNPRARSDGNSAAFSHDDGDAAMLENEADKMSLDSLGGPASASCSEAGDDDDVMMDDDPEDATDDEDWATVGAAALRATSYSSPAEARQGYVSSHGHNSGGLRSFSGTGMLREPRLDNIDLAALAASPNTQEREAIQALLQLGSV